MSAQVERLENLVNYLTLLSIQKHAKAVELGSETLSGAKSESQSHAYANAAMWLTDVVKDFKDNTFTVPRSQVQRVKDLAAELYGK